MGLLLFLAVPFVLWLLLMHGGDALSKHVDDWNQDRVDKEYGKGRVKYLGRKDNYPVLFDLKTKRYIGHWGNEYNRRYGDNTEDEPEF